MFRVPTPRARRVAARLALLLPILVPAAAAQAQSDAGPPANALIASAPAVRAGVAHASGLIAARIVALTGGAGEPGLALAPDRHVKVLALGNAGQVFPTADPEITKLERDFGVRPPPAAAKPRLGLWSDGAWSRLRFDDAGARVDGTMWSGVFGVDYALADRLTVGLAGAYESQDFDTSLNRASVLGRGLTAAPYAVLRLDRVFSLDASGGHAWLGYDRAYRDPLSGLSVSDRTDATRWFGAANLNARYTLDQWRLGGALGTLYAGARADAWADGPGAAYGAQTTAVGRVRLGYVFRVLDGLEPYVSAEGRYAALDDGAGERADSVLGVGASLRLGNARLGIQGTTLDGGDAVRTYAGTVNLRLGL